MFGLFKVHLFQSGSYIVQEVIDGQRFIVKHVFAEKREKWSRTYRTAIEIVQMADTNPESYEVAMSQFLDAMTILAETSKIKDGLGLEERVQAAGRASPSVVFESGSLRPDIVAPPKRKDIGRPSSARNKPGYEKVSVPRTKICTICCSRVHRANCALPTRTRSHVERPIARIAVWLGTRRTIA
jgi:hypothetical protein